MEKQGIAVALPVSVDAPLIEPLAFRGALAFFQRRGDRRV